MLITRDFLSRLRAKGEDRPSIVCITAIGSFRFET